MYMYTYIQLNTAYLYHIYRRRDVALRYIEMSILWYIETCTSSIRHGG